MKILPNPILAWASARFRSSSSACSHLAMPSAARFVHMSTSPNHIWPRGWSGTDESALIKFPFSRREGRGGIGHEEIYALDRVRARRSYERFDVAGVGDKRAIETNVRLRHVLRRVTPVEPGHTLKIEIHRVRGRRLFRASRRGGGELVVQCAGETGDDLVLHVEEIGARLVETLGPEMITRFGVDELHIDAHAITAALNAAFDDITNVQLAADLLEIDGLPFVGECGVAPHHDCTPDP